MKHTITFESLPMVELGKNHPLHQTDNNEIETERTPKYFKNIYFWLLGVGIFIIFLMGPITWHFMTSSSDNNLDYCVSQRNCRNTNVSFALEQMEAYHPLIDIDCYELTELYLCAIFFPQCDSQGKMIQPCQCLCIEFNKNCAFFLDIVAPEDYGNIFECHQVCESSDADVCIGQKKVDEVKQKQQKTDCRNGYRCDKTRCISMDWRCDGYLDCLDNTDEMNCPVCGPGTFKCGPNQCITFRNICDGIQDCPSGMDESNCLTLSERTGDEAYGQLQVYNSWMERFVPACMPNVDIPMNEICLILGYSNLSGGDLGTQDVEKQSLNNSEITFQDFICNTKSNFNVDMTCSNYMCGILKNKSNKKYRHKRVVGGTTSKPGDWPFLVSILGGPAEIFYCAGVLIADQWVLTAAHCIGRQTDVTGWTIHLGNPRRYAYSYYGRTSYVKRVISHPNYNLGSLYNNDVALMQLTSRVPYSDELFPVCLPPVKEKLDVGRMCTVIGWGKKQENLTYTLEINEVEVQIMDSDLCDDWVKDYNMNVTTDMICAGYEDGGKDACKGDSGGPLLCRDSTNPERWFVAGIVSWGIQCGAPNLPGVYSNVQNYMSWIQYQMSYWSY